MKEICFFFASLAQKTNKRSQWNQKKKENSQCAIVEHWLPLFDRGWLSETCNPFQSSSSPFCKSWFEPIKIDKTNVLDHGRQVDRSETQNILCLSADSLSTKMSQDLKRRFSPDQWRQCQAAIPCFLEIRVSDMFQFGLGHVCRTLDQELLSLVSDTLKAYKEKHPSWVLLMKQIHEGWGLCKPKRVLLGHQMMIAIPKDKEQKTVRFGMMNLEHTRIGMCMCKSAWICGRSGDAKN